MCRTQSRPKAQGATAWARVKNSDKNIDQFSKINKICEEMLAMLSISMYRMITRRKIGLPASVSCFDNTMEKDVIALGTALCEKYKGSNH